MQRPDRCQIRFARVHRAWNTADFAGSSNAMPQLLASGLYSFTPRDIRPKSMIHRVAAGEVVRHDGKRYKRFHVPC